MARHASFPEPSKRGALRLIASGDGRDGSLRMAQDASVYASILAPGNDAALVLGPCRHAWVQIVRGAMEVNGTALLKGDGAAIDGEEMLRFVPREETEFLAFDLP